MSVNSPGNPWSQSGRRKGRLRWETFAEKKGLSLKWKIKEVIDDESGGSMELTEEVPLKELGEAELHRLVRGWRIVLFLHKMNSWLTYFS